MQVSEHFRLKGEPFSGQAGHLPLLENDGFQQTQQTIIDAIERGVRLINLTGPEGVGKSILLGILEAGFARHALVTHREPSAHMIGAKIAASADVLLLDEIGEPVEDAKNALQRLAQRPVKPVIIVASVEPLFTMHMDSESVSLNPQTPEASRAFILRSLQVMGGNSGLFTKDALDAAGEAAAGRICRLRTIAANSLFDAAFEGGDVVQLHNVRAATAKLPTLPTNATQAKQSPDILTPGSVTVELPSTPLFPLSQNISTSGPTVARELGNDSGPQIRHVFPWLVGGTLAASVAAALTLLTPNFSALRFGPWQRTVSNGAAMTAPPTPAPVASGRVLTKTRPALITKPPVILMQADETAAPEAIKSAPLPAEKAPEILIRYAETQADGASLALETAAFLRARGYRVSDVATAPFGIARGSTRYFAPEERNMVSELNQQVSALLSSHGHDDARVMDMSGHNMGINNASNMIEIWVPGKS